MISKFRNTYEKLPLGAKAALWYSICNMLQKAIAIIVVPIYTRILPASDYGTYTVFVSWSEIFEIFVTFRLFYDVYLVGLVKYEDDRETYTSSLEQLTVLITLTATCLYIPFREQINAVTGLNTFAMILMLLLMLSTPVVGFWRGFQRVNNNYKPLITATIAIALLSPILGISGVLLINKDADTVMIARTAAEVIIALILLFKSRDLFVRRPKKDYWKYALSINVPLIPFYLSTIILNHSDRIIIQQIVGYSEVGIYSVAYSAAMITLLFNTALDYSISPWVYRKVKKGDYEGIPGVFNLALMIIGALNLLLIAFGPEAIKILAPAPYHEAIWIIPPLASSVFIMFMYLRFVNMEFYFEESKITGLISIGAAALNVFLNFALIPKFGYLAAGYTTLFSYAAFGIMHFLYTRHLCKKHDCPMSMFGIRNELIIFAVFTAAAVILSLGYKMWILRYTIILIAVVIYVIKRKELISLIKNIASLKKKEA